MDRLRECRRGGFTLIEILVVLAIMMMMMAMAMFAFVDFGRGAKMRAGALSFRSAFNGARQHAITHRTRTYLFYGNTPSPMRGYYVVSNAANGVMGSTNFMPVGVVFSNQTESWAFQFKLDGSCPYDSDDNPATTDWIMNQRAVAIVEGGRGTNSLATSVQVFRLTGTIQRNE
jgi:type II secretory pathway pseudopilin PulG